MKNFLAILFVALCVPTFSQDVEYQSPLGPPVPIPSVGTAKDTIVVSSTWFEMDCISFGLKEVVVHFDHDMPIQTSAHLVHNSDTVALFYQGVLINDSANDIFDGRFSMLERSIVLGEPPYNEVYAPVQNIGSFNSWMNPNGIWELLIVDHFGVNDSGTLFSWSLVFGEDSLVCPTSNNYSDATRALSVCDNGFITSGGYDAGIYLNSIDIDLACVGEETASSWVNLEIEQSGSLSFIVHSATNYDFSIWQIDLNNTWSPPLRCSSVIDGGATGLDVNATVNADSLIFLPSLLVQANERYMIYLNNEGFSGGTGIIQYDGSNMPYWIEWTGDAELSCNGLSVQVQERHNDASYEIVAIGGGSVRVSVDESATVQVSDLMGRLVVAPVLVSGVRLFELSEGQAFVVSVNGVGRKLFVP